MMSLLLLNKYEDSVDMEGKDSRVKRAKQVVFRNESRMKRKDARRRAKPMIMYDVMTPDRTFRDTLRARDLI